MTMSTQSTTAKTNSTGFERSMPDLRRSARSDKAMVTGRRPAWSALDLEDRRVAALDLAGRRLDARRVLRHQLDLADRAHPGLLHRLLVRRILPRPVDDELLALARLHPVVEQPRGIRVGRGLEDRARRRRQRRTLLRVDDLDRLAGFLVANDEIARAVDHDGALAERDLLRRVGGRLHLKNVLLRELLEIAPAEIARDLEGRVHDGAAVGRMRLHQLAL